jgi:hypothetical protein
MDIDRVCSRVDLSSAIGPGTRMVLPLFFGKSDYLQDFSQDIMITAPGNPLFKLAVQFLMRTQHKRAKWPKKPDGSPLLYVTGMQPYLEAVAETLFGKQKGPLKSPPPAHFASKVSQAMMMLQPTVLTYVERFNSSNEKTRMWSSFTFRASELTEKELARGLGRSRNFGKGDFYQAFNVSRDST